MPTVPSPSVEREFFSRRLRALLEEGGISVGELARRFDPEKPRRGQRSIRRYLSGSHAPSEANLKRLAAALRCPVATLRKEAA